MHRSKSQGRCAHQLVFMSSHPGQECPQHLRRPPTLLPRDCISSRVIITPPSLNHRFCLFFFLTKKNHMVHLFIKHYFHEICVLQSVIIVHFHCNKLINIQCTDPVHCEQTFELFFLSWPIWLVWLWIFLYIHLVNFYFLPEVLQHYQLKLYLSSNSPVASQIYHHWMIWLQHVIPQNIC